jgi:hypothetical protein
MVEATTAPTVATDGAGLAREVAGDRTPYPVMIARAKRKTAYPPSRSEERRESRGDCPSCISFFDNSGS